MLYRTLLGFLCLFTLANAGQTPLKTDGQVHTFDSWDYVDCGLPSDAIQVKSIKVSPDPPQPGKELSVTEGAYADVTVKLGLIKLLSKQFDVCEEARNANTTVQCPVEEGTYEVTQKVDLPKEIPKAKFKVQVRGFTVKDEDMLCLDLNVNFMRGLPGLSW